MGSIDKIINFTTRAQEEGRFLGCFKAQIEKKQMAFKCKEEDFCEVKRSLCDL
jgi:hypothetical protein